MADKIVETKKNNVSCKRTKIRRAASTPRKPQSVTSNIKRGISTSTLSVKCQAPKSVRKHLFKTLDSPKFAGPESSKPKCSDNSVLLSPARKSVSLIDLSPSSKEKDFDVIRDEKCQNYSAKILKQSLKNDSDMDEKLQVEKLCNAGRIVCHMLAINAWRRRKEEIINLNEFVEELKQQMNHLQIQIVVLRRLLDTENGRVAKLTHEVQEIKNQYDNQSQQCENLRKEKEKVENELHKLKEVYENRVVMENNVRNELDTARNQLISMESQISRDRHKLRELREDKKVLLQKVSVSEKAAIENEKKASETVNAIEELQLKFAAQLSLVSFAEQEKEDYKKKLEAAIEEQSRLKRELEVRIENEKINQVDKANLENKISNLDHALRRVEAEYDLVLSELTKLNECKYNHWSNRVLQIAERIVRTPQTIFRSLSFL